MGLAWSGPRAHLQQCKSGVGSEAPTCRGRAGPEVMGGREGAVLFDKHGVVVRETSRRALPGAGREPAGFPLYQP